MKRIWKFLLLFIVLFVGVTNVEAVSLGTKDMTMECIYTDGGLYTSAYGGVDEETGEDKYTVNRTAYNLVGVDSNSTNRGSSSYVVNNLFVDNKCHETLYVASINLSAETEADEETGDSDSPIDFHKFGSKIVPDDIGASNSWWDYLWPTRGGDADKVEDAEQLKYNLVSERYILNSDVAEPNAIVYYKQEAEQVAGKSSYVSIMVYDNMILMKKNDRVTRLEGDYSVYQGITKDDNDILSKEVPEKIYINNPEPEVISNSSANVSNRFQANQKTFSVSTADEPDSVHTQEYILTDEVPDDDDGRGNALCDEILVNTSPYLKYVIKAMQVLVPLFLIVLTAFDIGKIVLTGNIEEELPKRKKIIIVRFVVAIVFFFLPSFISLFTTWLIDSGAKNVDSIEYIDCLFR